MSELIWGLTGQPFVLPVMLTGHIWSFWKWNKLKFPCGSVVSVVASRCVLSFAELWSEILGEMQQEPLFTIRALKTDIGVHALPVAKLKIMNRLVDIFFSNRFPFQTFQFYNISWTPELKCLVTKLFSMNTNFSFLVMRSNMDYWRSFRIKISHRDTYTRNHYIWRHLLCIYLFTNLMCTITIFNVWRVSLYSYRQCTINTHNLIFILLL